MDESSNLFSEKTLADLFLFVTEVDKAPFKPFADFPLRCSSENASYSFNLHFGFGDHLLQ
jgi:hypothetical protein